MAHDEVKTKPLQYLPHIDGIRAIAVIVVVLFHLDVYGFNGGFVGVDVFFVISGFLITSIIKESTGDNSFSLTRFYIKRFYRLFPPLLAVVCFSFLFSGLLFSQHHLERMAAASASAIFSVSNLFFWSESGYFDSDVLTKPLLHTWSLSVEEQFYLLWPILMLVLFNFIGRRVACIAISLIGVASLYLSTRLLELDASAAYFITPSRAFEFCIGGCMAWIVGRRKLGFKVREALGVIGLFLILYPILTYTDGTKFPGMSALIPCLGTAFLIYSGRSSLVGKVLEGKLFVAIGKLSYSIYLVHWPVIVFYSYIYGESFSWLDKAVMAGITISLSVVLYNSIEVPFRRLGGVARSKRPALPRIALGGIAPLLVLTAAHAWSNDGWEWRIKEEYRNLVDNPTSYHLDNYGGVGYDLEGPIGKIESATRLIVFGDSHALHLATGLEKVLKDSSIRAETFFSHGCMIGPGITRLRDGAVDETCSEEYPKIVAEMEGNNTPILISHSWASYSNRLGTLDGKSIEFDSDDEYRLFVIDNLEKTIELAGSNRTVIISGMAPGAGNRDGILSCLSKPSILSESCESQIRFNERRGRGFEINVMMRKLAEQHENVEFFDPYDAFCREAVCYSIEGDSIYYSDGGHLSQIGSNQYANFFQSRLITLLVNN